METVTISKMEYEILKNATEKLVKFNDGLLDKMMLEFVKNNQASEDELAVLNDLKVSAQEVSEFGDCDE